MTADHCHVFTVGGYPKRGNPIFGIVRYLDGKLAVGSFNTTYTTLGYANGRGGLNGSRLDLRGVETADKDYLQQATVLMDEETHGIEDVGKCCSIFSHALRTRLPIYFIQIAIPLIIYSHLSYI